MTSGVTEDLDVIIVGAGLSGIGAACHLLRDCPWASFTILEARDRIGGTWDLFRYPGVRSDSDMYTLGYSFEPWRGEDALAKGEDILAYLRQTAQRHGVLDRVRTGHRVTGSQWSSDESRWLVEADGPDGPATLSCRFLLLCTGYYRYDRGYTPSLPGADRFQGTLVHPQHWPADLDCAGRRVIVIGSGATAVTLAPALAREGAQVTMVQRSPSWVMVAPARDPLAGWLQQRLSQRAADRVLRAKNIAIITLLYRLSRRRPRLIASLLHRDARNRLPAGYPVHVHFNPSYDPWDQRMCFVPDGDLFDAISSGRLSIVTDTVQSFTERGLRLGGGRELEADVIVTATGLALLALGGIGLSLDGEPVALPELFVYRGMMLSGVPNLAITLGYTNASWTLKADLTARQVCRLLNHMRARGYARCVPVMTGDDPARRPLIELTSGYVRRQVHEFPSQGTRRPWLARQNHIADRLDFRLGGIEDGVMRFSPAPAMAPARLHPQAVR